MSWRLVALLAIAAVAAGCGEGETAPQNPEAQSEDVAEARCSNVPHDVHEHIAARLTVEGGATLRNAQAVRSRERDGVWFVSAELDSPEHEGDGDIATWALLGPDLQPADVIAVDELARQFSQADEPADAPQFSMDDDGVEQSRGCVAEFRG